MHKYLDALDAHFYGALVMFWSAVGAAILLIHVARS